MNFTGKCALVTGAAVGIGRAVAIKLAECGAKLVLVDIDIEKLNDVKKEIQKYTNDVLVFECNTTDEEKVAYVAEESLKKFGKIDILINNAAVWRMFKPFTEVTSDEWKKFLDINIMGVVHFTKSLLPKMTENCYGRIVNVASVAGVYGNANMATYSATKGAVISLTKSLAKEVAKHNITVNAVSPGTVSPADNPDVYYTQPDERSYVGRTGSDMENANLICFLASEDAGYISGQNYQIDGCRKNI